MDIMRPCKSCLHWLVLLAGLLPPAASADPLRILSWNIANLAQSPNQSLRNGQVRSTEDYQHLRDLLRLYDADIIAFQEIGSEAGLKRILPAGYEFHFESRCYSNSVACQTDNDAIYTAIAFKRELKPFARLFQIDELAISHKNQCGEKRSLRGAVGVTIQQGQHALHIPSLHLKSACKSGIPRRGTADDCVSALQQFRILKRWLDSIPRSDTVILSGDFNRRLLREHDYVRDQIFLRNYPDAQFLPGKAARQCWRSHPFDFKSLTLAAKNTNPQFKHLSLEPYIFSPRQMTDIDYFIVLGRKPHTRIIADQIELDAWYRFDGVGNTLTDCDGKMLAPKNRSKGKTRNSTVLTFGEAYPSDHCPILLMLDQSGS